MWRALLLACIAVETCIAVVRRIGGIATARRIA